MGRFGITQPLQLRKVTALFLIRYAIPDHCDRRRDSATSWYIHPATTFGLTFILCIVRFCNKLSLICRLQRLPLYLEVLYSQMYFQWRHSHTQYPTLRMGTHHHESLGDAIYNAKWTILVRKRGRWKNWCVPRKFVPREGWHSFSGTTRMRI